MASSPEIKTLEHNLEKLRREFVANVSHELRSPLTSLIGFVETLQNTPDLEEDQRQHFLSIMDEEAQRMSRLIDDLLSLSRVETEEHIAPTDVVYADEVLSNVMMAMASRAEKRDMSIEFENALADGMSKIAILGETDEITEVFDNLLDNAIKYGYKGTKVRVIMSSSATNYIVFSVINVGDGIEAQHIPRLTERFYRVDKSRSRQMGGTGLGLAIVKHIVNRHRGQINITSTMGGETTFKVLFPRYHDCLGNKELNDD